MMRVQPWRWLTLVALVVVAAPATVQLLLSWPLAPPVIEGVRILEPGEPDGSREQPPQATPRRIEVRFATPSDLERVRHLRGFETMSAVLSACAARAWRAEQLITQGQDYHIDEGRVRRLGGERDGGPTRYTTVFDDRLTRLIVAEFHREPAIGRPGGLCLSLRGGSTVFAASSKPVWLPDLH